jgi:hypothetical protein
MDGPPWGVLHLEKVVLIFLKGREVLRNTGILTRMFTQESTFKWKWVIQLGEHVISDTNHLPGVSHSTFSPFQNIMYKNSI